MRGKNAHAPVSLIVRRHKGEGAEKEEVKGSRSEELMFAILYLVAKQDDAWSKMSSARTNFIRRSDVFKGIAEK